MKKREAEDIAQKLGGRAEKSANPSYYWVRVKTESGLYIRLHDDGWVAVEPNWAETYIVSKLNREGPIEG